MATTLLSPVVVGRAGCGAGSSAGKSAAVAVCQRTVQSSSAALRSAKLRSLSGVAVCERRASRSLTCSRSDLRCKAAAVESSDSSSGDSALGGTLYLGLLFALWYAANIFFNIWNKQVLKAYAFPITGTFVQFFIGSCIAGAMWLLRIKEAPKVDKDVIIGILPLAAVHTLGNLLTNLSLSAVSVSFTHTIKAMEPFFSVMLSWLFLGSVPTLPLLVTLLPIVGGVALASFSEPSFNWNGFMFAMASNLTFQSRNVLSKKLMGGSKAIKKGSIDNINLFSLITIMSFFLAIPIVLAVEGVRFTPAALNAAGVDITQIAQRTFLAGLAFHSYQQVSYMILQRVTPVTHSVGNCVKRVVVIVSSVLFFRTPVSVINATGTAIALAGVFAYSRVTASKGKKSE